MRDKRRDPRIPVQTDILLTHPAVGRLCLKSRDLSDGGVFLLCDQQPALPPGTEVVLQVRDLADAPEVPARVLRAEPEGLALVFVPAP